MEDLKHAMSDHTLRCDRIHKKAREALERNHGKVIALGEGKGDPRVEFWGRQLPQHPEGVLGRYVLGDGTILKHKFVDVRYWVEVED